MESKQLLEIIDWATGDDTGVSSKALCRFMLGLTLRGNYHHPHDQADRGRCMRLLNRVPEWWDRLDEMANIPSTKVTVFGKNGIETRQEGWKDQIALIRKEAGRNK